MTGSRKSIDAVLPASLNLSVLITGTGIMQKDVREDSEAIIALERAAVGEQIGCNAMVLTEIGSSDTMLVLSSVILGVWTSSEFDKALVKTESDLGSCSMLTLFFSSHLCSLSYFLLESTGLRIFSLADCSTISAECFIGSTVANRLHLTSLCGLAMICVVQMVSCCDCRTSADVC